MPGDGKRRELVRGEVTTSMPPGGAHGGIAATMAILFMSWAKRTSAGYVAAEAGYVLARDPDTVRGPDVSFVRAGRIPATGVPEAFWELAPDLAVEIISRSESADQVREKVRDFLAAGTPLVWTVYPRTREVFAHTPDGLARTFGPQDSLAFPQVLPGFECRVTEIFG